MIQGQSSLHDISKFPPSADLSKLALVQPNRPWDLPEQGDSDQQGGMVRIYLPVPLRVHLEINDLWEKERGNKTIIQDRLHIPITKIAEELETPWQNRPRQ